MTGHGGPPLSVSALAASWSTSEQVVRRLLNDGALRGVKIGRSWRVFPVDAEAYIESRTNGRQRDGR
ncbi:helix-turn-helix domain-containing protein [Brachybacterium tyrofermentans]|uniref:helix-turn-helix domain-containing protein n=1 Tax=Brachybacterium tyrofermentans TaxID=47848 RepID=UPI003FD13912